MEFKREDCTFTVPDRPTVREQLAYYSAAAGSNTLLRYWIGAQALIGSWKSTILPDYKADVNTLSDPSQTTLIIWAGLEVMKFMNALDDIPKN